MKNIYIVIGLDADDYEFFQIIRAFEDEQKAIALIDKLNAIYKRINSIAGDKNVLTDDELNLVNEYVLDEHCSYRFTKRIVKLESK
jgi:hypothetical protein